jgi:hypothetical protein
MTVWDEQPAGTPADAILGGASAELEPSQVIPPERKQAAQQRAERIGAHLAAGLPHLDTAAQEYAQAIAAQDWTALGQDRGEWHAALFGEYQFTVEARQRVSELLSGQGMSVRQIAQATGVPRETVRRDLADAASPDVTLVTHFGSPPR